MFIKQNCSQVDLGIVVSLPHIWKKRARKNYFYLWWRLYLWLCYRDDEFLLSSSPQQVCQFWGSSGTPVQSSTLLGVHSITVFLTPVCPQEQPNCSAVTVRHLSCLFILSTYNQPKYSIFIISLLLSLSVFFCCSPYHLEPWPSCALPCVLSVLSEPV